MPDEPRVDVLIPVRAPAPWLREALESVLAQTSRDWRLLVVMDGFSAEVRQECDRLPPEALLQVEVLPAGSGLVAALNHGIRVSNAEYIARLDADDRCRPERIARQLQYLDRTPACSALGTSMQMIDEHGARLDRRGSDETGQVVRRLRWRSPIAHPSVMMRRADVVKVGGYSAASKHAEDFDLWLRLAQIGEIHVIPDVLVDYRIHAGQVTSRVSFPPETRRTVLESRLALARVRGESVRAARLRHAMWVGINKMKGR